MKTDSANIYDTPYQIQPQATPRQKKDTILTFAFWIVCVLGLLNINGLTALAFSANRLMSIVFLTMGLVILSRFPKVSRSIGASGYAFCIFILFYLGLGNIINRDLGLTVSHLNSIFIVIVSAVATRRIVETRGIHYFMKIFLVLVVAGAWTVFLSPYMSGIYAKHRNTMLSHGAGRWMGFFANPNSTGMAGVYALGVCVTCWNFKLRDFPFKKYLPLAVAITGLGVLLTFSRSSILTFTILGVGYAVFTFKVNRRMLGAIFGGVLTLTIAFWFFTGGYKNFDWERQQLKRIVSIEKIIKGESNERDLGGRMDGVRGGIDYWTESPFIGHGMGMMHSMPRRFFDGLGCHNTHLMVLGETGVIGFTVYLTFLFIFAKSALAAKTMYVRVFAVCLFLGFIGNALVSHGMLEDRNVNILLGVGFALMAMDRRLASQPH